MKQEDIKNTIVDIVIKTSLPIELGAFYYKPESNSIWFEFKTTARIEDKFNRISEIQNAINYLGRKVLEKKYENLSLMSSLIVDINGIEKKRIENIETTAHMMAERAKYFKKSVELEPMSPASRRIIHEYLSTKKNIKTHSTGEGLSRRVVIEYIEE